MKIVITGGAGFIGSHLATYWVSRNADVHVIDNLKTGTRQNLALLPQVKIHEETVTNKTAVFDILENADFVFHLAAMVSVPKSIEEPFECVEVNVKGLLNVLEAAKRHGVKKVVHSSSAAVYGDNPESPKHTAMKPAPKSPYGITKLDGEYYLQLYQETFGLNTMSLRYFNVFGPRQDPNAAYAAAIPIFITRALRHEPITIYGDGEQTRDFIFIKDVVTANVLAAESKIKTGVYNVACGSQLTIKEIAQRIISLTHSKSVIRYEPVRLGDIKHSVASIDETTRDLGFRPSVDLSDGLQQTIDYFSNTILTQKA
jgi:UDP-glucose 4-epimerase